MTCNIEKTTLQCYTILSASMVNGMPGHGTRHIWAGSVLNYKINFI